jgi:hypothetical protein
MALACSRVGGEGPSPGPGCPSRGGGAVAAAVFPAFPAFEVFPAFKVFPVLSVVAVRPAAGLEAAAGGLVSARTRVGIAGGRPPLRPPVFP